MRRMIFGNRRPISGLRLVPLLFLVLGVAAIDQATKWIILTQLMKTPKVIEVTSFFNLVLAFNTGVSFGMFQDFFASRPGTLALLSLAIVGLLMIWALRSRLSGERIGLAFMAGGALGNIIDRWRQGAVTDFLDFHWQGMHWPAFNAADVFIFVGAVLLIASSFFRSPNQDPNYEIRSVLSLPGKEKK